MQTAKEKQRTKEPVKIWLYELINLAYEMKIYLMSLQVKLFLKLNPVLSSEVRKLKPTCYNSLMMSPRSVKEMTVRLQDIAMDKAKTLGDVSSSKFYAVGKLKFILAMVLWIIIIIIKLRHY